MVRLRIHPVGRVERIASIGVATGMTVGMTLLVIAAPVHFTLVSAPVRARNVGLAVEQLVYLDSRAPAPMAVSAPRATPSPVQLEPGRDSSSTAGEPISDPDANRASSPSHVEFSFRKPDSAASGQSARQNAGSSRSTAGAPVDGLTVGFSTRRAGSIRFDSALGAFATGLAARRHERLALTQAERDVKLRAEALDAVAARGVGVRAPLGAMSGGGIAVPLPFGGPSREHRQRDSIAYAQTMEMMGRVQRRADSVIASRRRRFADSVALLTPRP